jgi:hypothetical protein
MFPHLNAPHAKTKLLTASLKSILGMAILATPVLSIADDSPWPVGVVDQANVQTQQSISIPVIANDTGDGLEIIEVNTTTGKLGSASISADKQSVTYQSAQGFVGVDTFWYAFQDDQGRTNAAKVTVNVSDLPSQPPEWPSAGNESPEVEFNTPTVMSVLDNDTGVGLTITSVNTTTVQLGSVSISADGKKLLYTPPQDFEGNDEFWYVFSDAWGRTNAGKVTPVVQSEQNNSPWPTATPDYTSTLHTNSILIPVLENDVGDELKLVEVNAVTTGLGRAIILKGKIRYAPAADFSGQDSFWYAFEDKDGRRNSTQVFVDVTQNTELSSISFCGENYFTDGTLANTTTSTNATDPDAVELDISVEVATLVAPAGSLAVVDGRRYFIETNAYEKQLVVENASGQRTVLHAFSQDEVYGISVRNNAFYFGIVAATQPQTPTGADANAVQHSLLSHDGTTLNTIGSYWLRNGADSSTDVASIEMMETERQTLIRFIGYEYVGEGPNVVPMDDWVHPTIGASEDYLHQYYEIEEGKAIHLATHGYRVNYATVKYSTNAKSLLVYENSVLQSSENRQVSNSYDNLSLGATIHFLPQKYSQSIYGIANGKLLEKAVLSNGRVLLITGRNITYDGTLGNYELTSLNSVVGRASRSGICTLQN